MSHESQMTPSDGDERWQIALGGGDITETVWVRPVGANRFEVDSIPFYAYNVSAGDVVIPEGADGFQVWVKGPGCTVRVAFLTEDGVHADWATELIAELQSSDWPYEINGILLAIHLPSCDELRELVELLTTAKQGGWEWELGDPQPEHDANAAPGSPFERDLIRQAIEVLENLGDD